MGEKRASPDTNSIMYIDRLIYKITDIYKMIVVSTYHI